MEPQDCSNQSQSDQDSQGETINNQDANEKEFKSNFYTNQTKREQDKKDGEQDMKLKMRFILTKRIKGI